MNSDPNRCDICGKALLYSNRKLKFKKDRRENRRAGIYLVGLYCQDGHYSMRTINIDEKEDTDAKN